MFVSRSKIIILRAHLCFKKVLNISSTHNFVSQPYIKLQLNNSNMTFEQLQKKIKLPNHFQDYHCCYRTL